MEKVICGIVEAGQRGESAGRQTGFVADYNFYSGCCKMIILYPPLSC